MGELSLEPNPADKGTEAATNGGILATARDRQNWRGEGRDTASRRLPASTPAKEVEDARFKAGLQIHLMRSSRRR